MLALLLLGAVATPDCVNQYGWVSDILEGADDSNQCAMLTFVGIGYENCPLNRTAVSDNRCGNIFDVCHAGGAEACPACLQCTGTPVPDCVGDRGWSFTTVGEDPVTATCATLATLSDCAQECEIFNGLCHGGFRDPSTGYFASQVCSECQQCTVPEGPLIPAEVPTAVPPSAAPTSSASAAGPHLLVVVVLLLVVV
jgi:hypothetical protein